MAVATSSKRRFEYVGGTSNKFWSVTVQGPEVTVRYGRNGTDGQTLTKKFLNAAAAQQHAGKLILEKIAKGYIEVP